MEQFEVLFYEKGNGDCPIEDFLDSLDLKMRAKMVGMITILQEKGNMLREPYSKYLGNGIFELRGTGGSNNTRVLYFFYHNGKIILTNGFVKKTQKTPPSEIEKALKIKEEYYESKK